MHVGIVMGSDSDLPAMKKAFEILDGFGVTYDVAIASAHRTPKKLAEFVAAEEEKGAGAFIAMPAPAMNAPAPFSSSAATNSLPALAWQQPFRVW